MKTIATKPVPHLLTGYEVALQPKSLYKQQLSNRLRELANEEYQLMLKMKFLANKLRKPAFTEIIHSCEVFSDTLMATLNHYTYHIKELENADVMLASLVKPCEEEIYAGWVDRAKEIISLHAYLKEQIVDIFISFNELEYPETFHFLKQQLALHEDQLWHFRHQVER